MHTQLTEYTKISCWLQGTKGRGSLDFIISYRIVCFCKRIKETEVGSSDCGLFAIANVMALASGIDIERVTFRQTKMRSHFLQCLQEQRLTMFPHKVSDSSNSRLRRKLFVITTNCHCNAFLPNSNLIKCSECNKLFHLQCLTHSHQNSNSRHTSSWTCQVCTKKQQRIVDYMVMV